MFKYLVCALLLSVAYAAPGVISHYPAAVSHVSRVDIHDSKPYIAGYESPLGYGYGHGYAPLGYAAGHYGGYGHGYGYPVAQSYSNRVDVHHNHGYYGYGIHDGYELPVYGYSGVHGY